jgi:hypothetical protein
MTPELSNRLAELAAKLGISVEHLWSVLVRQAYIDGLSSLGTMLLCGVIAIGVVYAFLYLRRKYEAAEKREFWVYPPPPIDLFFLGAALAVLLVIASANFYWVISDFFNPEFYAFRQLPGIH